MLKGSLLFLLVSSSAIYAQNSCDLKTCATNETNEKCIPPNSQIPAKCSKAVVFNLKPMEKEIIKKHNQVRNRVAGGSFPATRMGTMRWHQNFADFSKRIIRRCEISNNVCLHTADFQFIGESTGKLVYPKAANRSNSQVIMQIIDNWIAGQSQTTKDNIIHYPLEAPAGRTIRYFCQMVQNFSTRVGCSAMRYEEGNNYVMLLTCLYDLTNIAFWPVFENGPTATKCRTGTNRNYPNLCSFNESFNVNSFWEYY